MRSSTLSNNQDGTESVSPSLPREARTSLRSCSSVPGVREAAVVAKKHPMLDEVPVVFIIPLAGVERAPPDLHDHVMAACRNSLADFKVPREIRFVDEMPRSTLEKVAKAELRKLLG